MTPYLFQVAPGLRLDARRAAWLEEERTLLVADTHLGYAWAHRQRGNLLPIGAGDDTLSRLRILVAEYAPAELIILGDVIHAAVRAEAVAAELRALHDLGPPVRLIAGNHDRALAAMLAAAGVENAPLAEFTAGAHSLIHGDACSPATAEARCATARARGGRVILGHEHPAISLSDGVATNLRCPCFLVAEDRLVLPAFTQWSSGTDVRSGRFLSAYAEGAAFTRAVACVAGKLLPLPL